jgi:hypothetical protein
VVRNTDRTDFTFDRDPLVFLRVTKMVRIHAFYLARL